jgi:mercuric ion transport protein
MHAVRIELIYEKTCPNIDIARNQLLRACGKVGVTPHWQEWEVSTPETPDYARRYGSPTILVNGQDVSGEPPSDNNNCCRLYDQPDGGTRGAPALVDVVRALKTAIANDDEPQSQSGTTLPVDTASSRGRD